MENLLLIRLSVNIHVYNLKLRLMLAALKEHIVTMESSVCVCDAWVCNVGSKREKINRQKKWVCIKYTCYQPSEDRMRTRAWIAKHLLVPCETKCLTEQQKHKNNLLFIAFRIIHGKIEWLARMFFSHSLSRFLCVCVCVFLSSIHSVACFSRPVGWTISVCVRASVGTCNMCVSVAVSRPHHFFAEWNKPRNSLKCPNKCTIAIFSPSLRPFRLLFISSLNTVHISGICSPVYSQLHYSPIKMSIIYINKNIFIKYLHFCFTFIINSKVKFSYCVCAFLSRSCVFFQFNRICLWFGRRALGINSSQFFSSHSSCSSFVPILEVKPGNSYAFTFTFRNRRKLFK